MIPDFIFDVLEKSMDNESECSKYDVILITDNLNKSIKIKNQSKSFNILCNINVDSSYDEIKEKLYGCLKFNC